jgi:transposase-like protein
MATRYPAAFRERAVELAPLHEQPLKQLATDLGISDQTLHNWVKRADIDAGRRKRAITRRDRSFA